MAHDSAVDRAGPRRVSSFASSTALSFMRLPGGILASARAAACVAVIAAFSAAAGCGRGAATPRPPAAAEPATVTVRLVDHDALMATVAALRGRIVVLDCWSTSCPPCVREFPRLLALQERFGDAVACLSLSLDYEGIGTAGEVEPRVRGFLEKAGAGRIVNLLSSEESDLLCRKLDLASIPAIYVWRADGTLAQRFDDDDAARRLGRPFTYDDVELLVRGLLPR